MEIKALHLEIFEAERLIERNKIILQLHQELLQAQTKIKETEESTNGN